MGATDFTKNTLQDMMFRGQNATINGRTLAWDAAPTLYVGLIGGPALPNLGAALRSADYAAGDCAWPAAPNGRLYRAATGGTTGADEPDWPDADGGTVEDGTVVWAEQTPALAAGDVPEPSGGAYARRPWACSLAKVMGCGLSDSASASSGGSGVISNLDAVVFPVATAAWGPVWGMCVFDEAEGGNPLHFAALDAPRAVGAGDQLAFAAGEAGASYGAITVTLF
jgi:hypothetical protein